ncbi:MAG: hypothetical protein AB1631_32160 [Acidobacteriota bacterium]
MDQDPERDEGERIGFWGGWRGLYLFILIYGLLQVVLLYLFTLRYN